MVRDLKVLGLALVAMLAMTAAAPSVASADDLTSEKTPVTLTGRQTGADLFLTTIGTAKCKEVIYSAVAVTTPTTAVSVTPNYPVKTAGGEENCIGFGFPLEIHTSGCTYTFTIGAATTGGFDIICPAGKEITITAGIAGITKCIVHIPAQTLASGATYSNRGAGTTREIGITANIVGALLYKHTAGTGVGACTSGSGVGNYGSAGIATGESGAVHVGVFLS